MTSRLTLSDVTLSIWKTSQVKIRAWRQEFTRILSKKSKCDFARWIISCWCTCSMKASVFLHIFGGFFLTAAHEFLMNAETHTRMRRNTKWNADEENGEEECKLIRRVRNIFVHEKPSGGEQEEEATLSLETRDTGRWRSLFRFWSISLSRWQRSFESSLELRRSAAFVIETQGLFSTRNRLGDNFNQLAYIFLQSTHIKKTRK